MAHAVYIDRFGNVQLNAGHEELAELGLKLGQRVGVEAAVGRVARRALRPHVRGCRARPADASTRTPTGGSRSRSATATPPTGCGLEIDDELRIHAAVNLGTPRVHFRLVDSTNERARALAGARRAARDAGHRARAVRRARAPGAGPGPRRPGARCCARCCCATRRGCCRWPRVSPSPRWSATAPASSGQTTCSSTDARSRGSWSRVAPRSAGRCSASG